MQNVATTVYGEKIRRYERPEDHRLMGNTATLEFNHEHNGLINGDVRHGI